MSIGEKVSGGGLVEIWAFLLGGSNSSNLYLTKVTGL